MKALRFPVRMVIALCLAATTCFSAGAAAAADARPPIVHLISVGDSADGRIGRNVREDAENTVAAFEQSFAQAGKTNQLKTRLLVGRDATAENLLRVIESLEVRPQDTIVLLISSHGETNARGEHQIRWTLGRELTPRSELLDAMRAKNPRLAVLLTDVCSSYSGGNLAVAPSVQRGATVNLQAGQVIEWSTMRNLFLDHSGIVDITAAEPGYPADTNGFGNGSHFTNAMLTILKAPHGNLVRGLDRDRDGAVQWDEFLPQLRSEAAERDRGNQSGRPQHAYARSLGRWSPVVYPSVP